MLYLDQSCNVTNAPVGIQRGDEYVMLAGGLFLYVLRRLLAANTNTLSQVKLMSMALWTTKFLIRWTEEAARCECSLASDVILGDETK